MTGFRALNRQITACELCPRLRRHCTQIAAEKRRAYLDWDYWGRPVPNFGSEQARLLIVGLAPAAHGANRTGRMFTGDRSGEWLYRVLFEHGFANQPESTSRQDGLELIYCAITAVCHCAPPDNKPSRQEEENCRAWLEQTFDLVKAKVLVALGHTAWNAVLRQCKERGWQSGPKPKFGHLREAELNDGRTLLGSYHPSQQNTFTGRLTKEMFSAVFARARELLDSP